MDRDDRERLRQRLNFPEPIDAPGARTPRPLPPDDPARERAPEGVDEPAPPAHVPEPQPAADVDLDGPPTALDLAPVLEHLAGLISALDERVATNTAQLDRLHERLDALELLSPTGEEMVGLEAVRRTVAASHRALTTQLRAMIDDVERRLRAEADVDGPVAWGSADVVEGDQRVEDPEGI